MALIGLGTRRVVGVADTSGQNIGRWTAKFDAHVWGIEVPYFEVYKIVASGQVNSTFTVFVGPQQWSSPQVGTVNEWETHGEAGLQLIPGTEVWFYWSNPVTDNVPPIVTCWIRYDTSILANQSVNLGSH